MLFPSILHCKILESLYECSLRCLFHDRKGLRLSLQLHTRLHKLEQERREQNAKKMEAYTQQVALEQLKDENKDKARLAQKLAELEVLSPFIQDTVRFARHIQLAYKLKNNLFE